MTRVTIKVNQLIKEGRIYKREVVIEGRVNTVSGTYHFCYDYVNKRHNWYHYCIRHW